MEDFQVFIKPVGARCNLNCSYCYYLDKQDLYPDSQYFIQDDLLEQYIIQHIDVSADSNIFFSWHGGEPTIAGLDFFRRAISLQRKHLPKNRTIINGIQTNGTLLNDQWGDFLKREKFIAGISLDGPDEFHDVNRPKKDGKPTFNGALRGYQLLRKYEIPCEILCVVSASNVDHPLEVYRFFKELDASFITFIPLVVKDEEGNVSEQTVNPESFGKFLCTIFDEWKRSDIGRIKIQIIEEALRTAFGREHTLCVFKETCGRVPVIEHNGDFYSCDHFVDKEHLIGNIKDHSLSELLEDTGQISFGRRKYDSLPQYCLRCEVLKMCNGACPKDRFSQTPEGEDGLNYLCKGYRLFFNYIRPFAELVARVNAIHDNTIV
jgi:uncharacterized protein